MSGALTDRVPDCWHAVLAAERRWFEAGGIGWLVQALVPDSTARRRSGRLRVPGFDVTWWWQSGGTRLSTWMAVAPWSDWCSRLADPSVNKDCVSVQSLGNPWAFLTSPVAATFLGEFLQLLLGCTAVTQLLSLWVTQRSTSALWIHWAGNLMKFWAEHDKVRTRFPKVFVLQKWLILIFLDVLKRQTW